MLKKDKNRYTKEIIDITDIVDTFISNDFYDDLDDDDFDDDDDDYFDDDDDDDDYFELFGRSKHKPHSFSHHRDYRGRNNTQNV